MSNDALPPPRPARSTLGLVMWSGVALLVFIGVAASVGRAVFIDSLASRAEPLREQTLRALDRNDPVPEERARAIGLIDSRLGSHPITTVLHILPGAIFLVFASFQFSARIRTRHLRFHRWNGRFLVVTAVIAAFTGLYFGVVIPFAGRGEALTIGFFGTLFLVFLARGVAAIRRRDIAGHREWMIRVFALALGISTVRIAAAILDVALTPAGVPAHQVFILSLWVGWVFALVVAEMYIVHTRPRVRVPVADFNPSAL